MERLRQDMYSHLTNHKHRTDLSSQREKVSRKWKSKQTSSIEPISYSIGDYMEAMDHELRRSRRNDERMQRRQEKKLEEIVDDTTFDGGDEDGDDDEEFDHTHLPQQIMSNLLASYQAQYGAVGPVSILLSNLGFVLPENADDLNSRTDERD